LVVLKADDLERAVARVEAAGGVITDPIFDFPGGRRFHFRDPAGNELGVWAE
jgi:predicted enzyme related to lactoylglutathione lyase